MGNLCRVPSERPVLGKEVVAEREGAPRDLRVSRGDLGGGPGSRFRGPAPKDDPCFLLGDALRDGRRDGSAEPRREVACLFCGRWCLRVGRRCWCLRRGRGGG